MDKTNIFHRLFLYHSCMTLFLVLFYLNWNMPIFQHLYDGHSIMSFDATRPNNGCFYKEMDFFYHKNGLDCGNYTPATFMESNWEVFKTTTYYLLIWILLQIVLVIYTFGKSSFYKLLNICSESIKLNPVIACLFVSMAFSYSFRALLHLTLYLIDYDNLIDMEIITYFIPAVIGAISFWFIYPINRKFRFFYAIFVLLFSWFKLFILAYLFFFLPITIGWVFIETIKLRHNKNKGAKKRLAYKG